MIASAGLVGEVLACAVSFRRLSTYHRVPLARSLWPTALVVMVVLLAGAASLGGAQRLHPVVSIALALVGAALAGGVVLVLLDDTRREAWRLGAIAERGLAAWLLLKGDEPHGKPGREGTKN
jgi:hypothetical protein